jgi:tetratricopeptide (TPR) repeat protein
MRSFKFNYLVLFIFGTTVLTGCVSLKNMEKDAGKMKYSVVPETLETHNSIVNIALQGRIPEKYFLKNATIIATPVLNTPKGEKYYEPFFLQGESVKANNKAISFADGGSISYKGSIPFDYDMRKSELVLKIRASMGKQTIDFLPVKLADGVIATSTLVDNSPFTLIGVQKNKNTTAAYNPATDKYQRIVPEKYVADLVYLINSSEVRTQEMSKEEIKQLSNYITEAYKADRKELKGVEISAYASPDGGLELNTKLSEKREGSASQVIEKDLIKNNVKTDLKTKYTPEDWDGFKELMEKSTIQDKELILRVLSMYADPEVREREIKNLSSAFTSVATNILPKLRRSKITASVDVVGRTDEENSTLAINDPSKLNQAELLYAASITDNPNVQKTMYTNFTKVFADDWRGFNNLGSVLLNLGDIDGAAVNFEKADRLNPKNPIIQNNLGCVELKKKNLTKAEELFGAATGAGNEVNDNLGIVKIMQGQYETASKYFNNNTQSTANRALAQLLSNDNNGALSTLNAAPVESGRICYLKAIIAARTAKTSMMYENLAKAIKKDEAFKALARTDLEFAKYFDDQNFKLILNN